LGALLVAGVAAGVSGKVAAGQNPQPPQDQGPPGSPPPDAPPLPDMNKRMLDENQKEIKKKVEQLFDLATKLKEEVEKTDSSKVLSLNLVRKAEEIEKLAHDIKNRAKG